MKHLVISFLILVISATYINAQNIEGRVLNSKSSPLQDVSVFLKNDPFLRVFTNEKGEFIINLDGIVRSEECKIVFSHIGHETKERLLKDMKESTSHDIILLESSIILKDVTVVVQKKLSRKERENRKIAIIEQFKKQLKKDFIIKDRAYKIESKIEVVREAEIVFYNKLIGEYKELSGLKPNKRDSISSTYTDIENYMDNDFKLGINKMSDRFIDNNLVAKKRKENKRMLDSAFYKTILTDSIMHKEILVAHKALWNFNRKMEKNLPVKDIDPDKWEVLEGSEQTILRYIYKRGLLGIVQYLAISDFIVDPYNFSLERSSVDLSAEINIPFGYKVPPDALMLLNVINLDNNEMKKYKVRHFHVDAIFNTTYKKTDETKYGAETSLDLNISLTDTKKHNIKIDSKANLRVLSIE